MKSMIGRTGCRYGFNSLWHNKTIGVFGWISHDLTEILPSFRNELNKRDKATVAGRDP